MNYKEKVIALLNSQELSKEQKEKLEEIFPELKESEDEKIRNKLIEQVVYIVPNNDEVDNEGNVLPIYQQRIDKYIAWLEKQTEKSADKLQVSGELYEHIRNTCACIDNALSSETLADINDHLSMAERSAQSAFDMIEKQCEQNLVELPKGEDYGIDGLYAAIDILKKTLGKVDGYQTDDGILEHKCAISCQGTI